MNQKFFKMIMIMIAFLLAGTQTVRANALYDTTTPGHNLKHVVLYSYAVSGGHPNSRGYTRKMVAYFASKYGFRLDTVGNATGSSSANAYAFTPANLQGVSLLMADNGDGNVFVTDASQSAVIDYVENQGGALFLVHASAAFIPCPVNGSEFIDSSTCKFLGRATIREYYQHNTAATPANFYADSVVAGPVPGTGVNSPYCSNQAIPLIVTDHPHGIKNPETMNIYLSKDEIGNVLPRSWVGQKDEWYTYRTNLQNSYYENVRATKPRYYGQGVSHGVALNGTLGALEGNVNVLFSIDETHVGTAAVNGTGASIPTCPVLGDHPEAWTRKMGTGITAYNSMGHDENEAGSNNVILTQNDSAYMRINWRIMRYLAGDFAGCMDPNYKEYNPEATVRLLTGRDSALAAASANPSIYPCSTPVTAINVMDEKVGFGIQAGMRRIEISANLPGTYHILLMDTKGREIFSKTAQGGLNHKIQIPGLSIGTYFVRVNPPRGHSQITKRISLY